jgi:hypothetical protein
MKKTLSALLLLSTIMVSMTSQVSAAQTCQGKATDVAMIEIKAVRQNECGIEFSDVSHNVEFSENNYQEAQEKKFVLKSNNDDGTTLKIQSQNGALKSADEKNTATIGYTIGVLALGPNLDGSSSEYTQNGKTVTLDSFSLHNTDTGLTFTLDEAEYDAAPAGTYEDTITLTMTYGG